MRTPFCHRSLYNSDGLELSPSGTILLHFNLGTSLLGLCKADMLSALAFPRLPRVENEKVGAYGRFVTPHQSGPYGGRNMMNSGRQSNTANS